MKTKLAAGFTGTLLYLAISPFALALAQDGGKEALYVKSLAASCANCHGTNGDVAPGSRVPALAGLNRDYFIAQMQAFKTGARSATVMHQLSKGFSDTQIATLASYFAAQKNKP